MSFAGSTAIVTGGASGIGLAISERLARDGAKVSVFDLDVEQAERAVKGIRDAGGEAIACQVDVSDRVQVDEAVEQTRRTLGPVLVLVNGAGKDGFDRFMDISTELWERIISVNLTGTFHCTQSVLPDMLEAKWGRIVNISSSSAQTGAALMGHYSASKGGVIALTKTLALELGPQGITVNTIPPGAIDTPMSRRAADEGRFGGGTLEDVGRHLPVRRIGVPEDIAAACAYLVSDDAGYVTGQVIGVNGGRVT
jgi:NAD(P)-dependent dehydrogenase (short-subunit alcohol dehydrogenase family)